MKEPDGKIDLHGRTWKHLSDAPAPVKARPGLPKRPLTTAEQALVNEVPTPARNTVNKGLTAVDNDYMLQKFGQPRVEEDYTQQYQPVTNPALKPRIITQSVGPFSVTGLNSAVNSLATVLAQVKRDQLDVYKALGSAGMLNCRLQRPKKGKTTKKISNHSWGTAIDLTLCGLDPDKRGNNKTQAGLLLIVPIFNQYSWYWGGAFGTEDSMHFEASRALIEQWAK